MSDEEEFVCLTAGNSTEIYYADLSVEKLKSIWEIRSNGKRLWIKSNGASVKFPFAVSPFKQGTKDGTFVINMDENLSDAVQYVDSFVYKEFLRMYQDKVMSNVLMTKGTLKAMFRESIYMDTLRLNVSPDSCAIFTKERGLLEDPVLHDVIKPDLALSIVVEPAFVWMRNGKIGIHWAARQVKIDGTFANRAIKAKAKENEAMKNWKLSVDDEDDEVDGTEVKEKEKEVAAEKKHKIGKSFLSRDDEDEEEQEQQPQRLQRSKKKVLSKSFLSPDSDSESESAGANEVNAKPKLFTPKSFLSPSRDKTDKFAGKNTSSVGKQKPVTSFLSRDSGKEDGDIQEAPAPSRAKKATSSFLSRDSDSE